MVSLFPICPEVLKISWGLSSVQNVAGRNEISVRQTSQIEAKFQTGLRKVEAEAGKVKAMIPTGFAICQAEVGTYLCHLSHA